MIGLTKFIANSIGISSQCRIYCTSSGEHPNQILADALGREDPHV